MNIIELAKEAGYFLYDLTETHGIRTVETDESDQWAQLERFAALVREERDSMWLAQMEFNEKRVRAEALEASRQALEALVVAEGFVDRHSEDWYISGQQDLKQIREAITNIRDALAEQIPEWVDVDDYEEPSVSDGVCGGCTKKSADGWALYCVECWEKAEPVRQEPVAWAYIDADGSFMDALDKQHGAYQTPLYAAPVSAKLEWVDLTDDEVDMVLSLVGSDASFHTKYHAVIAAFKEKNK